MGNKPFLSLIAAMAQGRVLGVNNQLPWHIPADLRYFREKTRHKPIIMGRKTFESIGRPLPERHNIILSRQKNLNIKGVDIQPTLEKAIESLPREVSEIMVIGGATVYEVALPFANRLYLTLLDLETVGDCFFPDWHHLAWHEVSVTPFFDETSGISGRFVILERAE